MSDWRPRELEDIERLSRGESRNRMAQLRKKRKKNPPPDEPTREEADAWLLALAKRGVKNAKRRRAQEEENE